MPTPQQLSAEISTDPQRLGYAGKGDADVAALLNNANAAWSVYVQLAPTSLLKWAANGPMQQIQDFANLTTNNASLRAICMAALQIFNLGSPLDLTDPQINGTGGMLQTLEAGGVITSAQLSALLANGLGSKTPCSRAEVLWGAGTTITHSDVRTAQGRG